MGNMNYGFYVFRHAGYSEEFVDKYLELREKLFGYARTYPEVIVPVGDHPDFHVRMVHLKNAHLGLVRSYEEAEQMLAALREVYPGGKFEIICVEYSDGENIQWYTATGIVDNKDVLK